MTPEDLWEQLDTVKALVMRRIEEGEGGGDPAGDFRLFVSLFKCMEMQRKLLPARTDALTPVPVAIVWDALMMIPELAPVLCRPDIKARLLGNLETLLTSQAPPSGKALSIEDP